MDIAILEKSGEIEVLAFFPPIYGCETEEEIREELKPWCEEISEKEFVFKKIFPEDNRLGKFLWAICDYKEGMDFPVAFGELIHEVFEAGKKYGLKIGTKSSKEIIEK